MCVVVVVGVVGLSVLQATQFLYWVSKCLAHFRFTNRTRQLSAPDWLRQQQRSSPESNEASVASLPESENRCQRRRCRYVDAVKLKATATTTTRTTRLSSSNRDNIFVCSSFSPGITPQSLLTSSTSSSLSSFSSLSLSLLCFDLLFFLW